MKNPTDWKATPHTHSGKIDKSGGTHWDAPKSNGERDWTGPTPYNHSKPTPRSSKPDLGAPRPMSSDRSFTAPNTTMMTTPKSMPTPPVDAVKWHKKSKYNLVVPATEKEAAPLTAKMKAH